MTPPTALLTGGAGFIGSNLVRTALARGWRVVNLDALTYAGSLASIQECLRHPHHVFVHGNVGDLALVRSLLAEHRPAVVLHLAAESHVDRSIDGPRDFIATNVVGTHELLAAAREHWEQLPPPQRERFRFIQVSTDEVFGSIEEGAFHEASPYRPNSPYAATKAAADHLARAYQRTYGLPVMVTNCSNNYGPYQFPEKLIPLCILKALAEEPIPIYGDGLQVRDWLHVEDHCDALLTVAERGVPGETYIVGGGTELTNLDLVSRLCAVMDELRPRPGGGRHLELLKHVTDRPGHDRRYAVDGAKLERELGWRPRRAIHEGLTDTVRWYLAQGAWLEEIRRQRYAGERLGLRASPR